MGALVLTDEELIEVFKKSGDTPVLDELVRRHVGKVRAIIYPMVLNSSDADDLTQEVFLRAIRGIAQFNGESRFSTWLYRVTMNTVKTFLDRRSRSPVDSDMEPPEPTDSRDGEPDRVAMMTELNRAVTEALTELSPPLRAAVVLTKLQGHCIRDAAQIEGCSTATMYWRVHEARKILRGLLAKYLEP